MKNQTTYCTGRHKSTELRQIKSCHGKHRKTWYREQDMSWMIKESGFNFQQEQGIFLSSKASQLATEPIPPPLQWVTGAHDPGIMQIPARSWPLTPTQCPGSHSMLLCFCSPKCLRGMLLNKSQTISLLWLSVTTANSSSHFQGHHHMSTWGSDKCYTSGTHPLTARVHKPQEPDHPGNWGSYGSTQHL